MRDIVNNEGLNITLNEIVNHELNKTIDEIPVRIKNIEMSSLGDTRFEGCFNTLRNSYTKTEIDTAAFKEITQRYTNKRVQTPCKNFPGIKTVHFSGPCTVIIWGDKTKTIVRCKDENVDYEKGFAMAIAKKVFGTNKSGSNYYDIFKKYLPEYQISDEQPSETETPKTESPTEVID